MKSPDTLGIYLHIPFCLKKFGKIHRTSVANGENIWYTMKNLM